MDNSPSKPEDEISSEQTTSQDFSRGGRPRGRQRTFERERGGTVFPQLRLVLLGLGLLNAVLLIAVVVIGIYCAKSQDGQLPDSVAAPLITELNYLRNHSGIIRAKMEAQGALVKERASHIQLRLQIKQQKSLTDSLQGQIETLRMEKRKLQSNITSLETSCGRCRLGWILLQSSCYYISTHTGFSNRKNWFSSREHCISQGGDLLVLDNGEEPGLIRDHTPRQSDSLWWHNGYWIGLKAAASRRTWVWVNNVTAVETEYWMRGQPSLAGLQSGNCAAYFQRDESQKSWYNANCDAHQLNWICEMKPSQT